MMSSRVYSPNPFPEFRWSRKSIVCAKSGCDIFKYESDYYDGLARCVAILMMNIPIIGKDSLYIFHKKTTIGMKIYPSAFRLPQNLVPLHRASLP
jgi:hypothetical protein